MTRWPSTNYDVHQIGWHQAPGIAPWRQLAGKNYTPQFQTHREANVIDVFHVVGIESMPNELCRCRPSGSGLILLTLPVEPASLPSLSMLLDLVSFFVSLPKRLSFFFLFELGITSLCVDPPDRRLEMIYSFFVNFFSGTVEFSNVSISSVYS